MALKNRHVNDARAKFNAVLLCLFALPIRLAKLNRTAEHKLSAKNGRCVRLGELATCIRLAAIDVDQVPDKTRKAYIGVPPDCAASKSDWILLAVLDQSALRSVEARWKTVDPGIPLGTLLFCAIIELGSKSKGKHAVDQVRGVSEFLTAVATKKGAQTANIAPCIFLPIGVTTVGSSLLKAEARNLGPPISFGDRSVRLRRATDGDDLLAFR